MDDLNKYIMILLQVLIVDMKSLKLELYLEQLGKMQD
jgi:hypothetical protein